MVTTEEVFGIRNEPVLSYVVREGVDGKFKAAISTDHHIVVYGSSKQGKTTLRQKHLPDKKCVIVRCGPGMTTEGIYSSVIRQEGIKIQTIETSGQQTGGKIAGKVGFKAVIPWIGGAKTETSAEASVGSQSNLTQEFVSFDFSEAQSIGELLTAVSFDKFIVLENFHYLSPETQTRLAFDLKTFHEIKIRFVILGIWWEANHLMTYNGDLQDRLLEVPVEPWSRGDFESVAVKGSEILKVRIEKGIVDTFIDNSYGNIGMMQEFLKAFCLVSGVSEEQTESRTLSDVSKATETLAAKADSQKGQLLKTLQNIAANSRVRSNEGDPLLLPYYLAIVICKTPVDQLRDGIEKNKLLQLLRDVHHREDKDTVRTGDVTNLLTRLSAIQKGIQPPFLYYDSNNRRLRIVDTRYFFVLANANCQELAEDIPFPRDSDDQAGTEGLI